MEILSLGHIATGLSLALVFGGMTFFSAVMAPLIFTKLPGETAAAFIRQVFPWYYLTMGIATLVALLTLVVGKTEFILSKTLLTALVLAGFVFGRQVLMPKINHARDNELSGETGASARFQRLHRLSVIINGVQWLAVLAALVLVLV